MRILIELGHPAHFHLFRNAVEAFHEHGHQVMMVVKQKDVLLDLVAPYQDRFEIVNRREAEKKPGALNNMIWVLESGFKVLRAALQFKPDILIGSNFSLAHVGRILDKPSFRWIEDDARRVWKSARIANPFAKGILVPDTCPTDRWEYKTIHYPSYHELAYLAPTNFTPDKSRIEDKIDCNRPFIILRMSRLAAHHDKNMRGLNRELTRKLIYRLEKTGRVYITSERAIDPEFEPLRIAIPPRDMHHAIYYAHLYIGDSQTMAAEAAVLGTPSIRHNDFVGKLGYLEELEQYGLTWGIPTNEPEMVLEKVDDLLSQTDLQNMQKERRKKMLRDKIDLNAFMIWFVEHYPESFKQSKENREVFEPFRFSESIIDSL